MDGARSFWARLAYPYVYSTMWLLPIAAILIFCVSATGRAAAQGPATPSLYRIAGTVVNKVSGELVPRASVALLNPENNLTVASTYSDPNGRFALDHLPEGRYQLVVAKRGYLTSIYEQHEHYNSAIVTGPEQKTGAIVFRLTPAASLSVTVIDEAGDPVDGARVLLFRKVHEEGLGASIAWLPNQTPETDDTGKADVGNLEPGDYFIAVSAKPWYAIYPDQPLKENAPRNPALDVAYSVTFYNGVTDQASATPIQLAAGRRESVQIALQAVPALHLSLPVKQDDLQGGRVSFFSSIFGFNFDTPNTAANIYDGHAELTGVAPGHYEMQQGDPPRLIDFDANASQQFAANSGDPASAIHVKLLLDGKAAQLEHADIRLVWADRAHPRPHLTATAGKEEFLFVAVPPGRWELQVFNGTIYPLPILSIANNGTEHPGNLLKITERTRELTVHLSSASGHISGFAKVGSQGKAGAMVVLAPPDPAAHGDYFRRDQADSDGSFNLLNVAPGNYTLVAIEEGWDLEWQRPEVIARFLSHGVPVHVPEGEQKPLQLAAPIPVQKADGTLLAPASAETSPQSPPGTSSKPGGEGSL